MVDTWQPIDANSSKPDLTLLQTLAKHTTELESDAGLGDKITQQDLARARSWIQLDEGQWLEVITAMDTETRLDLATFYTVAEIKLNGWQARDKNPAIWIYRFLKKTQQLPEKHIIKALKSKTDNRFIPYGSVL